MKPPSYIADHIRRVLIDGGSAPHSAEVQWFFKEEVQSRGWYTDELRKVAARFRKALLNDAGLDYAVQVADELFTGDILEEKTFAVYLLQRDVEKFGDKEFKLFESWLDRCSTWADHDALASFLLGPMIAAEPKRAARVFIWAKSRNRWRRRASAVGLIRGASLALFPSEVERITETLLNDQDDMVQKGLGWLLRVYAKCQRQLALPLIMSLRERAPRLVLRTACETLPPQLRSEVLDLPRRTRSAQRLRGGRAK